MNKYIEKIAEDSTSESHVLKNSTITAGVAALGGFIGSRALSSSIPHLLVRSGRLGRLTPTVTRSIRHEAGLGEAFKNKRVAHQALQDFVPKTHLFSGKLTNRSANKLSDLIHDERDSEALLRSRRKLINKRISEAVDEKTRRATNSSAIAGLAAGSIASSTASNHLLNHKQD